MQRNKRNIPLFKVFMPKSVIKPLRDVLFSGYIGEGAKVVEFEKRLAPWLGSRNVLALNNGTSALQLALRLSNVRCGDEVISTPVTCVATNEPILVMGAKIVWADVDPWTGNIDPADVARKITARTKAIMCVHWGGYPCDLNELNYIAAGRGIKLIEDACHAFGSSYRGDPIGSHSDFACFSFQAIKELTTVDGGVLTARSKDDSERGRLLRWYGIDRRARRGDFRCETDIAEYGYKFHMNDVTAAIGIEQLKYVHGTIRKHRSHARQYDVAFKGMRAVRPLECKNDRLSSFWLYTVRVKDRPGFIKFMHRTGIIVSQVHARNDTHTAFRNFRTRLPGVDEFTGEQVSIPVGWWLSDKDIRHVIESVKKYEVLHAPEINPPHGNPRALARGGRVAFRKGREPRPLGRGGSTT